MLKKAEKMLGSGADRQVASESDKGKMQQIATEKRGVGSPIAQIADSHGAALLFFWLILSLSTSSTNLP